MSSQIKSLLTNFLIATFAATILWLLWGSVFHRSLDYNHAQTLIGKGKTVAALFQGQQSKASVEFLKELDKVRFESKDSVDFIDVELNKHDAERFFVNFNSNPPALVLFAPDGKVLGVFSGNPKDGADIKNSFDEALASTKAGS